MTAKILCVDDDVNILAGFQRQLRKQFHITGAMGGEQGLKTLAEAGPFAVVMSDLQMPGMDGLRFLAKVRETSPGSVRIMLTGQADLTTAIAAVNEGSIFRFLTKPCPADNLAKTLSAALEQHSLVVAEKDLLENTLRGCVKVLTEILSIAQPNALSCTPVFGPYFANF